MLNQLFSWRNMYRDIGLFSIGIFIKLLIIHNLMGISDGFWLINAKNFLAVIAIYCLASLASNRMRMFLAINMILSSIICIDIIYYNYFFTLAPAHSVFQVGQLGTVSASIFSQLRLQYLLFFTDTILLWRYYKSYSKEKGKEVIIPNQKAKLIIVLVFFILTLSTLGLNYKTAKDTEGNYTPHNLGVINYHLYDIVNLFTKSTLDNDNAEALAEVITSDSVPKTGFRIAEDKNVIVIQAESVQSFVINREIDGQMITPVLNELIKNDSTYFSRFYEQAGWGNTSDAEFVSHNGFYPSTKNFSYKLYEENDFITLPMLLKERDYSTIAFHGNVPDFWNRSTIYPSQGLDKFISLEDFEQDELIGIGLSDGSLFRQSIHYLQELTNPFYAFYITLTSHHPFTMEEQYKGLNISGPYKDTVLEDYLQTIHYLDKEIGNFIEMLKEEGLYEDSIIVIYGDHQGLDMRNEEINDLLSSFLGKSYQEDEMFRVPLIIHMENSTLPKEISTAGGQIDFTPTIGNLLGVKIEPDKILGKDLLNIEQGFVAKQVHVARGSFIDDEKIFIMSNDGIFENSIAWNIQTREAVDIEECRAGYERALAEVNLSEYILENNLISMVKEKGLEYIIDNRNQNKE
ncbi:MAG: hypothetical protein APF76_01310 [Desulfitibacter sp. BRH_c19]|nr:MAG: hypothetical protein APF76_01310 [Desulfitibacter sp. BRH_c19]